MKNVKGYVSEKILDCLVSGIVPIYAGADDIAALLQITYRRIVSSLIIVLKIQKK